MLAVILISLLCAALASGLILVLDAKMAHRPPFVSWGTFFLLFLVFAMFVLIVRIGH